MSVVRLPNPIGQRAARLPVFGAEGAGLESRKERIFVVTTQ